MCAFIVSSSYFFYFFSSLKYLPISINIIMIIPCFTASWWWWWIYENDEMCIFIYYLYPRNVRVESALHCICASIQHWFSLKLIEKDIQHIKLYDSRRKRESQQKHPVNFISTNQTVLFSFIKCDIRMFYVCDGAWLCALSLLLCCMFIVTV